METEIGKNNKILFYLFLAFLCKLFAKSYFF